MKVVAVAFTLALAAPVAATLSGHEGHYQTLSNGLKMPLLALGVFQYNESQAEEAVKLALQNGFDMIDGGQAYANNKGVGRAINELVQGGLRRREDIWVQAKIDGCGFPKVGIRMGSCYEDTATILNQQLEDLNVSYVDSAIIHFPPFPDMMTGGCVLGICKMVQNQWKAMVEFYKANKTRAVGISNYCKDCFHCLEKGDFDVMPHIHQIQYHLGMGPDKLGYLTHASEHKMAVQAYSTLANKPEWYFWEPKGINPRILHGDAFNGKLGSIAKNHSASTIQVALKWIVARGITALTKSSNPKHLQQDADLWSFNLSTGFPGSDMAILDTEIKEFPPHLHNPDHGLHGNPSWACHPPVNYGRRMEEKEEFIAV